MKEIRQAINLFNTIPRRYRILIALLAAVILARFYYNGVCQPKAAEINRLKNEFMSLSNRVNIIKEGIPDIRKEETEINALKEERQNLQKQLDRMESSLIAETGIPGLLGELVDEAKGMKVEFVSVKPKQGKYNEFAFLDIEMAIRADFQNLVTYLSKLENLSQFLRVMKISIEDPASKDPGDSNNTVLLRTLLGEAPMKFSQKLPEAKNLPADSAGLLAIKRNPFISALKRVKAGPLEEQEYILSGTTLKGESSTAIINGEVYRIGEMVGGVTVKQILADAVVLGNGKEDIVVSMD